ncbi:MAG: hypothetical protein JO211_03290, partial [Acidobacteriaceae bacterium]|nr:hypothetical protein [Acidobacteriaceae bacterium]
MEDLVARRSTLLALVLILLGSFAPIAAAATPPALRIMTFNIRSGTGEDDRLDLARTAD